MSWHYSRALEEEFSEVTCSDGELSAPSSGCRTLETSSCNGKTMESCDHSRSGTTCRPSTGDHGLDLWMSSLEASRAKTSVQQGKARGSTESVPECGRTWPGSLARYDRDSRSWKTPQCSLLEGLDVFSETWPRWGMMRNGECWELPTLAGVMTGTASGFSHPTPTCSDHKGACARDLPRLGQLKDWMFETLTHNQSTIYPTPGFMERVMGWPTGWTELKPLQMGNLRQWQQQHSGFWPDGLG